MRSKLLPQKSPRKNVCSKFEVTKRKLQFQASKELKKDKEIPTAHSSKNARKSISKELNKDILSQQFKKRDRKPFDGKAFYLDGISKSTETSIKKRICYLGGVVEEFLSKEIFMVITSQKVFTKQLGEKNSSSTFAFSPAYIELMSPYSNSQDASPQTSVGAVKKNNSIADTRAKHILNNVNKEMTTKVNVVEKALKLNIRVLNVQDFIRKYMKNDSSYFEGSRDSTKVSKAHSSCDLKVEKLTKPYMKTEDQSKKFKPLLHYKKTWPVLYLEQPVNGKYQSPFDPPEIMKKKKDMDIAEIDKETMSIEEQRSNVQHSSMVVPPKKEKFPKNHEKKKKSGYCDCCCVNYESLSQHLKSHQHRTFSSDVSNFTELDAVIKSCSGFRSLLHKLDEIVKTYAEPSDESSMSSRTQRKKDRTANRKRESITPTKKSHHKETNTDSQTTKGNDQHMKDSEKKKQSHIRHISSTQTRGENVSLVSKKGPSDIHVVSSSPPINVKRKRRRNSSLIHSSSQTYEHRNSISVTDGNIKRESDCVQTRSHSTHSTIQTKTLDTINVPLSIDPNNINNTNLLSDNVAAEDDCFNNSFHVRVDDEISFNVAALETNNVPENLVESQGENGSVECIKKTAPISQSCRETIEKVDIENVFGNEEEEEEECFLGYKNNEEVMCHPETCDSDKHDSSKLAQSMLSPIKPSIKQPRDGTAKRSENSEMSLFSDMESEEANLPFKSFTCSPLNIDNVPLGDQTMREIIRKSTPSSVSKRKSPRLACGKTRLIGDTKPVKLFSPSRETAVPLQSIVEERQNNLCPSKRKGLSPDVHTLPKQSKKVRGSVSDSDTEKETPFVRKDVLKVDCTDEDLQPDRLQPDEDLPPDTSCQYVTGLYDRIKARRVRNPSSDTGNEVDAIPRVESRKLRTRNVNDVTKRVRSGKPTRKASSDAMHKIHEIGVFLNTSHSPSYRSRNIQTIQCATNEVSQRKNAREEIRSQRLSREEVRSRRLPREEICSPRLPREEIRSPRLSREEIHSPRLSGEEIRSPRLRRRSTETIASKNSRSVHSEERSREVNRSVDVTPEKKTRSSNTTTPCKKSNKLGCVPPVNSKKSANPFSTPTFRRCRNSIDSKDSFEFRGDSPFRN